MQTANWQVPLQVKPRPSLPGPTPLNANKEMRVVRRFNLLCCKWSATQYTLFTCHQPHCGCAAKSSRGTRLRNRQRHCVHTSPNTQHHPQFQLPKSGKHPYTRVPVERAFCEGPRVFLCCTVHHPQCQGPAHQCHRHGPLTYGGSAPTLCAPITTMVGFLRM